MVLSRPSRSAATCVAALLLMLTKAPAAEAMEPPSSNVLTELRIACDTSDVVRVTTAKVQYRMHRPTLDSTGVHHPRGLGRQALITIGDLPPDERRIPWAQISQIDVGQLHVGRSLIAGMMVGATLGGGLILNYGTSFTDAGDSGMVYIGASVLTLSLLGGWLHGLSSPHYEVLLTQNPSRR